MVYLCSDSFNVGRREDVGLLDCEDDIGLSEPCVLGRVETDSLSLDPPKLDGGIGAMMPLLLIEVPVRVPALLLFLFLLISMLDLPFIKLCNRLIVCYNHQTSSNSAPNFSPRVTPDSHNLLLISLHLPNRDIKNMLLSDD
jgi:hypothetical protein